MLADNVTRCAICRRTLLVGEAAHIYVDGRTRAMQSVCRLCTTRADRAGWEHRGEQSVHRPLRIRATPDDAAPRVERRPDRLVRRLHVELGRLEEDLKETAETEAVTPEAAAQAAREAQLAARLTEAESRVSALEEALRTRERRIRDLEQAVADAHSAQETLLRARRREADPAYLGGIACEVFNRSPQRAEIVAVARERGEPLVRVAPEGMGLPRGVVMTFGWDDDRYVYRVSCDLVARLFDVEDLSHGPMRANPSTPRLRPNARLVGGRVELDL